MHDIVTTIIQPWATAFATALVPVLFGLALVLLRKHGIDTSWFEAIGRAGGASYASLLASGKPVTDKGALADAAKAGADYLAERVPAIVASKGLTPDALAQVAGAQLGKVLALDPSIIVGGGSTATATAAPGETATATAGVPDAPPVNIR